MSTQEDDIAEGTQNNVELDETGTTENETKENTTRDDSHYETMAAADPQKNDTDKGSDQLDDPNQPPIQWVPPNANNNDDTDSTATTQPADTLVARKNNDTNQERKESNGDDDGSFDPENTFTVLDNYDDGFLDHSKIITISELVANREEQQTDRLSVEFFARSAKKQKRESSFLFAMMLRVNVPSAKNTNEQSFPAFKKNRFDRKPKPTATYKKMILLADLADPAQLPFVIMEDNNEQHNRLFKRDLSLENVIVGNRCAILTPKLDGAQLKNGAWVVTTNRPIEFLGGPRVPTRPLRSERIGHEIRYFILKHKNLMILPDDVVDPLKTKCNFHTCDRQNSATLGNTACGCWVQNRRSDNGPRNTVLMFPFYFEDSNGKIQKVNDFTSLRTSKLFFEGKNILADTDTLQKNVVYEYMQQQWRKTINYVNANGGWTIIGWYIRAKIDEEDKEDNDEDLYRTTVKINVAYLYPTKTKAVHIPTRKTMQQAEMQRLSRNDYDDSEEESGVDV